MNRGFFLALEGLDGAGKSTQIEALGARLKARGFPALAVKEPSDGPWGHRIRQLAGHNRASVTPRQELDYFVRDRAEDVENNIFPALMAGRPVIADRYILSNIAYQGAAGLDPQLILEANKQFPWPDLTVILELSASEGLKRVSARRGTLEEGFENLDYLGRVKDFFDRARGEDIVRFNALLPAEDITELIWDELRRRGFVSPEGLELVDSHCHLSASAYEGERQEIVFRARRAGVKQLLDVGVDLESSRQVVQTAAAFEGVHAVVGWHPHEAERLTESALKELALLAAEPSVVGFGEIGLDYYYMHSKKSVQLRAFESLLELAVDLALPVVIHTREAFDDTFKILSRYAPRLKSGLVIHCFSRGWAEASAWLDLGFYLSLPGVLNYPKNGELRQSAVRIEPERLLLETDSPYLAPHPLRGRRNEPSYLVCQLRALAQARDLSVEQAASLTTANARRLFKLP